MPKKNDIALIAATLYLVDGPFPSDALGWALETAAGSLAAAIMDVPLYDDLRGLLSAHGHGLRTPGPDEGDPSALAPSSYDEVYSSSSGPMEKITVALDDAGAFVTAPGSADLLEAQYQRLRSILTP